MYYKQPLFNDKVDYKSIIDECWTTDIDENYEIADKLNKKLHQHRPQIAHHGYEP